MAKPLQAEIVDTNLYEKVKRTYASRKKATTPRIAKAIAEGDLQGVLDGLTGKQRAFCEEYLKDLNGSEAVLRAGYQTTKYNANRLAVQLLNNEAIRFAIDGLKAQRANHSSVTDDFVLRKITQVISTIEQGDKYDAQSILRACELLGRHLGLFKDKQEISGPNGGPIETRDVQDGADAFDGLMTRLKDRAKKQDTE